MNQKTSNVPSGAAVACGALLGEKALSILTKLSPDECAHAYVQMNCFEWPDALRDIKPPEWDGMTDRQRHAHPEMKQVWHALHMVTSEFQRSRQWWRERLARTDAQHLEWWTHTYSPNTDYTKPN